MAKKKETPLPSDEILRAVHEGFTRQGRAFAAMDEKLDALHANMAQMSRQIQTLVKRTGLAGEAAEDHERRLKRIEEHLHLAAE